MPQSVFFNNRFIDPRCANVPASSQGFLYGWGAFESMRSLKGRIVYLKCHLARIKDSCRVFGIRLPYSAARLEAIIGEAVKRNNVQDAYVRLTAWKDEPRDGIMITAQRYIPPPVRAYQTGLSAAIASIRQDSERLLTCHKTSNFMRYRMALRQARARGFDEGILRTCCGYIAEGSRSNLFFVLRDILYTPALSCGCLPGITRKVVLDIAKKEGIEVREGKFTLFDLVGAQEAFLTNSLMGVIPLTRIEKKNIPAGTLTRFFVRAYRRLLER